jgi:TetR/AcrR family transcriptional regulator, ethionamide resistance regulator
MATRGARRDRSPTSVADQRDLRGAILDATERLLAERRFDELSVADVLQTAGISRASFYFYFESKHAVLAELLRRAVARGHDAAQPWLDHADDTTPHAEVRHGIAAGARLWREQAAVLRAVVENWRTDPTLTEVWTEMMDGFTHATVDRIARDLAAGTARPPGVDLHALASALTWLGERAYYLAAIGMEPFTDEQTLVDTLTEIWMAAVYGKRSAPTPD